MAPEVIELKGASPASDIWSLGCTVIELLTGKPPYSDIANGMSGKVPMQARFIFSPYPVMFRIVEDEIPPIPEECSDGLKDFLRLCFQKDPGKRPTAEMLCEHDWLKKTWGLLNDVRPQDSIPFLRRVSADFNKPETARYLSSIDFSKADSQTADSSRSDVLSSTPQGGISLPGSPLRRNLSSGPVSSWGLDSETSTREHSFIKTIFSKRVWSVCSI